MDLGALILAITLTAIATREVHRLSVMIKLALTEVGGHLRPKMTQIVPLVGLIIAKQVLETMNSVLKSSMTILSRKILRNE